MLSAGRPQEEQASNNTNHTHRKAGNKMQRAGRPQEERPSNNTQTAGIETQLASAGVMSSLNKWARGDEEPCRLSLEAKKLKGHIQ